MSNDANKSAMMSNAAMSAPEVNYAAKPTPAEVEKLDGLVHRYGEVNIVRNSDGTIDVRAGGLAAYARNLSVAIERRAAIEIDQVTKKIIGATGQVGGANAGSGSVNR